MSRKTISETYDKSIIYIEWIKNDENKRNHDMPNYIIKYFKPNNECSLKRFMFKNKFYSIHIGKKYGFTKHPFLAFKNNGETTDIL